MKALSPLFEKCVHKIVSTYYTDLSNPLLIIRYSGGKDSTLLVLLAMYCIKANLIPASSFEIINSDTQMEYPTIYAAINKVKIEAEKIGIKYTTVVATPNRGFFYDVFAKGLVMSNHKARRCTDRIKIEPSTQYLKEFGDNYYILTGVHFGESTARDSRLNKLSCGYKGNDCGEETSNDKRVITPIISLESCQVWEGIEEIENLLDLNDIYTTLRKSYTLINSEVKGDSLDSSLRTGCIGCPAIVVPNHYNTEAKGVPNKLSLKLALIYNELMHKNLRMISPKSLNKDFTIKWQTYKAKNGKQYHLYGAYPVEVRAYYWAVLKPLLLEIREKTNVKMISDQEVNLIDSSLKTIPQYPEGHTPEILNFLYQEWLTRKPFWI